MDHARDTAARRRAYFQLQIAAGRLRTLADEWCLQFAGITAAQAGVLFTIASSPGCTQRAVATTLRQRESAITAMVGRLTAAGLVERRRNATDARAWELDLTPQGRRAIEMIHPALDELNAAIGTAVGADNIHALVDALEALAALSVDPPDP